MKVRFYCVRHGETLFNVTGRVQGICDSPLTEKGIQQAGEAQHALRSVWFHRAYVSPSERCVDTADIILTGRYMHAMVKEDLHEQNFGILEGSDDPADIQAFEKHIGDFSFSEFGGESRMDVLARIDRVLKEIVKECNDGDHVLLVTHGAFMMGIMLYLSVDINAYINDCIQNEKQIIPNAGIMEFEFDTDSFKVIQVIQSPVLYSPLKEKKTVHFYFVRHGETLFNIQDRFQGVCDGPLTQKGIEQAKRAHEYLKDIPFAFACCSTSLRTRRTAQLILEGRAVSLLPLKGLREVNVGKFEAWKYTPNKQILQPRGLETHWKDAGGEDYEDVKNRMFDTFSLLFSRAKDGDCVLVVSHGTYYMNMLTAFFDIDRNAYRDECTALGKAPMPNCGLFTFDAINGDYIFQDYMKDITGNENHIL